MQQSKMIKITVDEFETTEQRGILPASFAGNLVQKSIDVSTDSLKDQIRNVISNILETLDDAETENDKYYVQKIDFTLGINSKGEVSLLSTLKGSLQVQGGFNITITRKDKTPA